MKFLRIIGISLIAAILPTHLFAQDLSQLNVYPNPVRTYLGDIEAVFDNVSEGTVTIYDTRGNRIKEISFSQAAFVKWDLRNDSGDHVVSGIYLYHINSGDQNVTGKLAVIR